MWGGAERVWKQELSDLVLKTAREKRIPNVLQLCRYHSTIYAHGPSSCSNLVPGIFNEMAYNVILWIFIAEIKIIC